MNENVKPVYQVALGFVEKYDIYANIQMPPPCIQTNSQTDEHIFAVVAETITEYDRNQTG